MWPFSKKLKAAEQKLAFKGNQEFFEYQCQFGHTTIIPKRGIIAIVLDGTLFGLPEAVPKLSDGTQQALVKVASVTGGFFMPTMTPTGRGERLKPDDIVLWVPVEHKDEGKKPRALFSPEGWMGFIVAKVKPEIDMSKTDFEILSYYDR